MYLYLTNYYLIQLTKEITDSSSYEPTNQQENCLNIINTMLRVIKNCNHSISETEFISTNSIIQFNYTLIFLV